MERVTLGFLTCRDTMQSMLKLSCCIFARVRGGLSDPVSRTTLLVHVAAILEAADVVILPAVFFEVRQNIDGISPAKLGTLTFLRCIVQALFSPVAAYVATRHNRINVIIAGIVSWSLATVGVGISQSFLEMAVFRGLNGIGLSLVVPSIQSILADSYAEEKRGWGFGLNATLATLGSIAGSSIATFTAQDTFLGLPCWRLSFFVMAILSCFLALCMGAFGQDPRSVFHMSNDYELFHAPTDMDMETRNQRPPRVMMLVEMPSSQATESGLRLLLSDEQDDHVHLPARPSSIATAGAEDGAGESEAVSRGNQEEGDSSRMLSTSPYTPSSSFTTITTLSTSTSINTPTLQVAPSAQGDGNVNKVWKEVWEVITVPTFMVIIAQGVVGTIPGRAMALNTMYFEMIFSHSQVACLSAIAGLGHALGYLFGGWVCDCMNCWLPDSGRAMCAQFSDGIKAPIFFVILRVLPRNGGGFFWYAILLFLVGVFGSWCGPGVNDPIMAEIVPERLRTTIYAYDRAFEVAIGSVGAPLAGLLAGVFGFDSSKTAQGAGKLAVDINANALSKGLTLSIIVPSVICCAMYSLLYLTYPSDRDRIRSSMRGVQPENLWHQREEDGMVAAKEEHDGKKVGDGGSSILQRHHKVGGECLKEGRGGAGGCPILGQGLYHNARRGGFRSVESKKEEEEGEGDGEEEEGGGEEEEEEEEEDEDEDKDDEEEGDDDDDDDDEEEEEEEEEEEDEEEEDIELLSFLLLYESPTEAAVSGRATLRSRGVSIGGKEACMVSDYHRPFSHPVNKTPSARIVPRVDRPATSSFCSVSDHSASNRSASDRSASDRSASNRLAIDLSGTEARVEMAADASSWPSRSQSPSPSPLPSPTSSAWLIVNQFQELSGMLEESNAIRDKFREIASDMDTAVRQFQSAILPVHYLPAKEVPAAIAKTKENVRALQTMMGRLAATLHDCKGQFYRYHDHWRNQTQTVVFLLAFIHWLETGGLLQHKDVEQQLEVVRNDYFFVDLDDYLIGICGLSNELSRYVVNRVTLGEYEVAERVSKFLNELYTAFRLLNLRNDALRKRFDALKYDLKRVEEVLYDVNIRGLGSKSTTGGGS
ncbi:hypothetical protein CBR_g30715 [Chara braunii]|uniref:Major facilitator superfamily (MFS) profile domain-containing protein n=1 Tax=Chara braunii TaxID=69332 RepID=A0A388LDG3_CHABU|nr:hypothetical protein CBR_g30715 [Chara braunii]|eukprot:GBG80346.1 hypothetical protein CBR_g30715 [Chara braunii]